MNEAVFHFCAMAQLSVGQFSYCDGCVRVPPGSPLDLDAVRTDAANSIAKTTGREAESLRVTLLSVTRLTP